MTLARIVLALAWLAAGCVPGWAATGPVTPVPQPAGRGTLVLEGGGQPADEATERIVALAGPQPRLCVIETASDNEFPSGDRFRGFRGLGLTILNVTESGANDRRTLDALSRCTGYYFGGGDPQRLSDVFVPDGRETPALAVIRRKFLKEGAVVSGSSAGAMIVSPITLCECGPHSSPTALLQGKLFQAPGFGLIDGILIDAHFFARGLLGRHLFALARSRIATGVGIDEQTAVIVPGTGGLWQVVGRHGAALVQAPPDATLRDLTGFRLSILRPGDRFDPATAKVEPDPSRPETALPRTAAKPPERDDIFSPYTLNRLIRTLFDKGATEAVGTAESGKIRLTLRTTPETRLFQGQGGRTVLGLAVDIERLNKAPLP